MRATMYRRRHLAALVLCLAGATAIALWAAKPAAKPTVNTSGKSAWVKHKDPMGFVIEHPQGWTVAKTKFDAIVVRSPEKTAFAVILPFSIDGPGSAQHAIKTLPGILLAPQLPAAEISRVKQLSPKPDLAIAEVSFRTGETPCRGNLMCLVLGTTGTLYGIAAPRASFDKSKATLTRIISSFKFAQPEKTAAGPKPAPSIEYVTWKDPVESSFTMQVPKGWRVAGGLVRQLSGCQPWVVMDSPHGDMGIFYGSGEFPHYVLPTALDAQFGNPEGGDAGLGLVRMRFLTGAQVAQTAMASKLAQCGFTDVRFGDAQDYPQLAQLADASQRRLGLESTHSFGSVNFTAQQNGKRVKGFALAVTQAALVGWSVLQFMAYVAEEGKERTAEAVMCQVSRSFKPDAQWVAGDQRAMDARIRSHESASASGRDASDIQYEAYKRRSHAEDEMARKWSNSILGQTDLRDAAGNTWKAEAGHNYNWHVGGTNTIIGSPGPDRPANDIDLTPLEEY